MIHQHESTPWHMCFPHVHKEKDSHRDDLSFEESIEEWHQNETHSYVHCVNLSTLETGMQIALLVKERQEVIVSKIISSVHY